MSLKTPGVDTSASEVTNIGKFGFWLLADDLEYFVPFDDYPSFKRATVTQIYNMQQLSPDQFHWPGLNIDIELGALERPTQYPLLFQ